MSQRIAKRFKTSFAQLIYRQMWGDDARAIHGCCSRCAVDGIGEVQMLLASGTKTLIA